MERQTVDKDQKRKVKVHSIVPTANLFAVYQDKGKEWSSRVYALIFWTSDETMEECLVTPVETADLHAGLALLDEDHKPAGNFVRYQETPII